MDSFDAYTVQPVSFEIFASWSIAVGGRLQNDIRNICGQAENIDLLGIKLNIKQVHSSYVKGCESYLEEI